MPARLSRDKSLMLAQPLSSRNLPGLGKIVAVQPKLNGERCKAIWDGVNQKHILLSSYGKEFKFLSMEHFFPEPIDYDGELYAHGWSREKIHSVVSRKTNPHPERHQVQFHVFDVLLPIPFLNRMHFLEKCPVRVETWTVHNEEKLLAEMLSRFLGNGYEGMIVRDIRLPYTPGRTAAMIKIKPDKIDRYEIVGFQEEIGIDGFAKNSLGSISVKDRNGNVFSVGTGSALTVESRKRLWEKRKDLIGRTAVVKQSLIQTVGGFPTCTSLVEIA